MSDGSEDSNQLPPPPPSQQTTTNDRFSAQTTHSSTTRNMWSPLPPQPSIFTQHDMYDTSSLIDGTRKRKGAPEDIATYNNYPAFTQEPSYATSEAPRTTDNNSYMTWPYIAGPPQQFAAMPLFASNLFFNQGSDESLVGGIPDFLGQEQLRITTTSTSTTETKRKNVKEDAVTPDTLTPVMAGVCTKLGCTHPPRFMMRDQPKPKQRKSYRNENRYLLPNPTQVTMAHGIDRSTIVTATCTIKLLDGARNRLPRQTTHYVENTEGALSSVLEKNQTAFDFALKVRQNSGPDKFRICFVVKYETSDGV